MNPCLTVDYPSPLGTLRIDTSASGLLGIWFMGRPHCPAVSASAADRTGAAPAAALNLARVVQVLDDYFMGKIQQWEVSVACEGTPFQRAVWTELTCIPFGETITYAGLAARIGRPSAVRAVAAAVGRNPISILVPCHRVIGSSGKLTGYAGGLDNKRWLLQHEQKIVVENGPSGSAR